MVECRELSGKVVRAVTLYEDGSDGPEICIEFTDGVVFNACLKTSTTLEARCTLDEGGLSWFWEFGQWDKWKSCSSTAM